MLVTKIRVYTGQKLLYKQNGEVDNENWVITLLGEFEFSKFLKNIKIHKFCDVKFVGAYDLKNNELIELPREVFLKYKERLHNAFSPKKEKKVTTEELLKQIKELKSQINQTKGDTSPETEINFETFKPEKQDTPEVDTPKVDTPEVDIPEVKQSIVTNLKPLRRKPPSRPKKYNLINGKYPSTMSTKELDKIIKDYDIEIKEGAKKAEKILKVKKFLEIK